MAHGVGVVRAGVLKQVLAGNYLPARKVGTSVPLRSARSTHHYLPKASWNSGNTGYHRMHAQRWYSYLLLVAAVGTLYLRFRLRLRISCLDVYSHVPAAELEAARRRQSQ